MKCSTSPARARRAPARGWWVAAALALASTGCPRACPGEPLDAVAAGRWVVRFNEQPAAPDTGAPIPGIDTVSDPPGTGTYAIVSVYDDAGALLRERWLDSFTAWPGATGSVDAASVLPWTMRPGHVGVLLSDGLRPAVEFGLVGGGVAGEAASTAVSPEAGGQLVDLAPLGDGTALASRRRAQVGGVATGGDLVLLDVADGGSVRSSIMLDGLSSGRVEPGRVAALVPAGGVATRALVGLALLDEPGAGAIALVDVGGAAQRIDLPDLSGCYEVTPLPPSGETARAAVLCAGDLRVAARDRVDAGVVLVESAPGGALRFGAVRTSATLFPGLAPTHSLVGLGGSWVAVVSLGDPGAGLDDALLAVDLSSDAGAVLWQESWTAGLGPALGGGAFGPTEDSPGDGELAWPSATAGVLRWRMTGTDERASFAPLAPAASPTCVALPPRQVRYVPGPPP